MRWKTSAGAQREGQPNRPYLLVLIMTRRYGPLRGPTFSSCGGLRPSDKAFFALRAKKKLIKTFSSNLSKFERNPKKVKKSKKIPKNPINFQK